MERARNAMLVRFSPKEIPRQRVECETVYKETFDWMRQCQPNLDPPMPSELRKGGRFVAETVSRAISAAAVMKISRAPFRG